MAVISVLLGSLLFVTGLAHLHPKIDAWDRRAFFSLNHSVAGKGALRLFRILWPLGTTPTALVLLALALVPGIRFYLVILLSYVSAVTIERLVKMSFKRPRPFMELSGIAMLQPRQPADPSFPSGDALRAWFLAIALTGSFHATGWWFVAAGVLAFLITLGRVALGVHYPLDALGGAGLGLLFAGLSLLLISGSF